ncbi:MAG: hypothetical protein ACI35V_03850 [Sphingobacterium composti]
MIKKMFLLMFVCIGVYACKKGDTGPQGPPGPAGSQGIPGVKGDNGSMIYSGNDVPSGTLGVVGDFYFRLSNSTFYGPKTAAGWGSPVSLRGATGSTGAAGTKILSGTTLPGLDVGAVGDFYLKTDQSLLFGPKTAGGWGSGVSLRGATGAAGTANVIYSGWMSFLQSQRDTIIDGTNLKVNHIPAPRLTQSIIDGGLIIVYWRFQTSVFQLPYTSDAGAGSGPSKASTISFLPKPGRIFITRYTHDDSASIGFGAVQFRYVIIPGSIIATLKNKNIDVNDPFVVDKALQERNP